MVGSRKHAAADVPASSSGSEAERLRGLLHAFVRTSGLLAENRTPCGESLSPSHAHALMFVLRCARSRPTQQDVGAALGIDKSNVTRLCRRMVRAGELLREPCARDGRARRLRLTPKGARLARRVEAASLQRHQALLEALPRRERESLFRSIHALNGALVRVSGGKGGDTS
jgi:DNA-binding MarR family transcriptional regulator